MLFNKGLAKQARLLALERNKAEIEGSLHQNGAMIPRACRSDGYQCGASGTCCTGPDHRLQPTHYGAIGWYHLADFYGSAH